MIRNWMRLYGEHLLDCGYSILPVRPFHKDPAVLAEEAKSDTGHDWRGYGGWTRHCLAGTTPEEVERWSTWPGCGIGIACGIVGALDIDVMDEEAAGKIEAKARKILGDTPTFRVGMAPKRLLPYRMAAPFAKIARHPLEFLGKGSQFVGYGHHPDTRKPYVWPAEDLFEIFVDRLPEVAEDQVRGFLEAAWPLVPADLRQFRLGEDRSAECYHAKGGDPRGTMEATADALKHIPNRDLPYDDWVLTGMATKASVGEEGRDLWLEWSRSSGKSGKTDTAEKAWASFKPTKVGFGTLWWYAQRNGWDPPSTMVFNAEKAEAARTVDTGAFLAGLARKADEYHASEEEEEGAAGEPAHLVQPTGDGVEGIVADAPGGLGRAIRWMTGPPSCSSLSSPWRPPCASTGRSWGGSTGWTRRTCGARCT
jgi:hypothetical protein